MPIEATLVSFRMPIEATFNFAFSTEQLLSFVQQEKMASQEREQVEGEVVADGEGAGEPTPLSSIKIAFHLTDRFSNAIVATLVSQITT